MKKKILVARAMPSAVQEKAKALFDPILSEKTLLIDEAIPIAAENAVEAIVFGGHLKLSADAIARLPASVKVLASTSAGFEHIDVEAAKAHGIMATYAPEAVTDCTADLAMMLILCTCRRAHEYDAMMRNGWDRLLGFGEMLGIRVSGKTLGIFGMGRIGRAVARRARGFGMRIVYHDIARLPPELEEGAEYYPTLEEFLPQCQVLSLHASGGASTDRIINAETIAMLPKGAVVVNAARGTLVDIDALIDALESGHLWGAGLDVYRTEPYRNDRLAVLPNTFLTPHIGGATVETREALAMRALDNVEAVLAGRAALDPLWR